MAMRARYCSWNSSSVGDPAHYHKQQWGLDRTGDVGGARPQVGCKACDKVAWWHRRGRSAHYYSVAKQGEVPSASLTSSLRCDCARP